MGFLPKNAIENLETLDTSIKEYRDFLFDKNLKKLIVVGEEKEALKTWIEYAIRIQRYKYSICPYDYGCELYDLMGEAYTDEEIRDLVEYDIIEAIKVNQYIDEVEVYDIVINLPKVSAKYKVKTIYGEDIEGDINI